MKAKKETIREIISNVLSIAKEDITESLCYQAIANWNSLTHIQLVLELEKAFNIQIDNDTVLKLNSVASIYQYCCKNYDEIKNELKINQNEIKPGLNNVLYAESKITLIDGENGRLLHSGYSIKDLSQNINFEKMIYLLIHQELPNMIQLSHLTEKIIRESFLSPDVIHFISTLKTISPSRVLQMTLAYISEQELAKTKDVGELGLSIIAKIPLIIVTHHACRNNKPCQFYFDHSMGMSANFLTWILGEKQSDEINKLFDSDMIIHADHGSNASAFVARIVTSTESDIFSAIIASISSFTGRLHGGALSLVMDMLLEIQTPQHVQHYIAERLKKGLPVYGFGHRVYRTVDPRARQLKMIAMRISEIKKNLQLLSILDNVEGAMQSYADHGIAINVDFYASIFYHLLNIPQDLFVSIFIASRSAGWIAQIIEQLKNNTLIRPRLKYVGFSERKIVHGGYHEDSI